jgi:energy-coupling factor transporter transmembrane protein EcfT
MTRGSNGSHLAWTSKAPCHSDKPFFQHNQSIYYVSICSRSEDKRGLIWSAWIRQLQKYALLLSFCLISFILFSSLFDPFFLLIYMFCLPFLFVSSVPLSYPLHSFSSLFFISLLVFYPSYYKFPFALSSFLPSSWMPENICLSFPSNVTKMCWAVITSSAVRIVKLCCVRVKNAKIMTGSQQKRSWMRVGGEIWK